MEYKKKISTRKTKTMAFYGKYPTGTKILICHRTIEQASQFNNLRCDVTYEINNDIQNKLNTFRQICSTITRTLKSRDEIFQICEGLLKN